MSHLKGSAIVFFLVVTIVAHLFFVGHEAHQMCLHIVNVYMNVVPSAHFVQMRVNNGFSGPHGAAHY